MDKKICTKCKLSLPLDKFYTRKERKNGRAIRSECKHCNSARHKNYVLRNVDRLRAYRLEYYKNNIEAEHTRNITYRHRIRRLALQKVGRGVVKCNNCGCTVVGCIEINHINGGGHQESKTTRGGLFHRTIVSGERSIEDLNLLCRVCNSIDYLQRKFGHKWEIKWLS